MAFRLIASAVYILASICNSPDDEHLSLLQTRANIIANIADTGNDDQDDENDDDVDADKPAKCKPKCYKQNGKKIKKSKCSKKQCAACPECPAPTPSPTNHGCVDNDAFKDGWGYSCADWAGYDCTRAHEDYFHTEESEKGIIANCPVVCGLCKLCADYSTEATCTMPRRQEPFCHWTGTACHECVDNSAFRDGWGYACTDWVGYNCSNANENYFHTQESEDGILANCIATCGVCQSDTTTTTTGVNCYREIEGIVGYGNGGGCRNADDASQCEQFCNADPQCVMYEMDATVSSGSGAGMCCLERCKPPLHHADLKPSLMNSPVCSPWDGNQGWMTASQYTGDWTNHLRIECQTTTTTTAPNCYREIEGIVGYSNAGGCRNADNPPHCAQLCSEDPQCAMYEMDATLSSGAGAGMCCLEHCKPPLHGADIKSSLVQSPICPPWDGKQGWMTAKEYTGDWKNHLRIECPLAN